MNSTTSPALRVQLRSLGPIALDAQFDCAAGELVALVGPSGGGKTSIVRAIAGLLPAHGSVTGQVTMGGSVWMDSSHNICLPPQARRCGMVFQQYALFPHLNAIENIAICAYSKRATDQNTLHIQLQARDWLARLGMGDLALRLPNQLSGGQQQRVALARALMRLTFDETTDSAALSSTETAQPRGVLLLDEPFSAVDAPMRQTLYRELAQLRQSLHIPIVMVTHDLTEARRLADRVVIVDAGTTLQTGAPERVMHSPRNARVAHLVGIHNHFAGHFYKATQTGLARLRWGSIDLKVPDKSKIPNNTAVTWVLAGDLLQVGLQGSPSVQADNVLHCTLTEALPLGEISLCKLVVQGTQDAKRGGQPDALTLNLPTAQLRAIGTEVGATLQVGVPPEAVHIMPLRQNGL